MHFLIPAFMFLNWNAILQIAILAGIFLYIYRIFKGTRSEQVLMGAIIILCGLFLVARFLNFDVILYLLGRLTTIIAIALVVVFQPEIRQAFRILGNRRFFRYGEEAKKDVIDAICSAAEAMSRSKTGAIMAIERGTHLREWTADATRLDAPLSRELLLSIFYPGAPLHDGGVVIKDETIVAARCVFPLSEAELGRGTRHRAALGLSERTDAIVVVVSEETGSISLACDGHFAMDLSREALAKYLRRLVAREGLATLIAKASTGAGDKGGSK